MYPIHCGSGGDVRPIKSTFVNKMFQSVFEVVLIYIINALKRGKFYEFAFVRGRGRLCVLDVLIDMWCCEECEVQLC